MMSIDEGCQGFLDFDWSDERWVSYLSNLYPAPVGKQLLKFKKKWYKKNIDPDFDESFDPEPRASEPEPSSSSSAAPTGSSSSGGRGPPDEPAPMHPAFTNKSYHDGTRWSIMGQKATICFGAYAVSLVMATGAVAGVFPAYQALLVLVGAFALEILAKYGLKFKADYMHAVLLDDVGAMPIMSLTLLTPGLHPGVRILALGPGFLTALLSFAQICKNHKRLPAWLRDFFAPLAEMKARIQVFKVRGHLEVAIGLIMALGIFVGLAAPFPALFFWNFMVMRYMMSSWTQASFKAIDDTLNPVLGKIPLIRNLYFSLKRTLYSFVDADARKSGSFCTIL